MNSLPKPADFFTDTPPYRIMGSETEYGLHIPGKSINDMHNLLEAVIRQLPTKRREVIRHGLLSNGGRLYVDNNAILEYATPECLLPSDVAQHEFAGMYLVDAIAKSLDPTLTAYRRSGYDHLEDEPESAGYHENYLLARPLESSDIAFIASFLATRSIWSGAGIVGETFRLSQKAHGIGLVHYAPSYRVTDHGRKPMVYVREDDNDKNWFRLETRCTDPNMSPWATITKFAMTSLALRLLEHQSQHLKHLRLSHPLNALGITSRDLGFSEGLALRTVRMTTAVAYQQAVAEAALTLADEIDVPDEEKWAALDVYETCDELRTVSVTDGRLGTLPGRLDWAAKLEMMQRDGSRCVDINRRRAKKVMQDITWEDASENGRANRLFRVRQPDRRFLPASLGRVMLQPPQTRANARVIMMRQTMNDYMPDWYPLTGPYESVPASMDERAFDQEVTKPDAAHA